MRWFIKQLKWIVFLAGLAAGVHLTGTLLYPVQDAVRNWQAFYRLEPRSVETLIVGSSHAYASFDLEAFGEQTGKTAYTLASNSQTVTQTYFNVVEALKYQSPEAIILEGFSIDNNDRFRNISKQDDLDWRKNVNIDGMRLSLTKLEAVCAQYYPSNWLCALVPLSRCHDNWKDAGTITQNALFLKEGIDTFPSFRPSVSAMTEQTMEQYAQAERDSQPYVLSESNVLYFHKLAALCREKDIALYVVTAPMYDVYIRSINYTSWHEAVAALTGSEHVPYLDCNLYYGQIGLTAQDFEDSFSSYHHLNAAGAEKVTNFVLEALYEA